MLPTPGNVRTKCLAPSPPLVLCGRGNGAGSRDAKRGVVYSSVGPVTVRLIDRQRRRRTMAAERDSMTRKAVLLDVFGMLLDDEADMHLTTCIRFVVTPFVFVLAASVGLAQQEGQQASAENARRIEVIQGEGHPWRVVDTIFRQPEFEGQAVADCVIGEVHPASERFYVRLGNMGQEAAAGAPSWDVGRHTGFRPASGESLVLYQRGPQQSGEGTAVQVRGREIGIWIDSDHPRPRIGALLPVCPAYWWWNQDRAPWPFREADRELSFSFDLKVPTAERQGQAEVYIWRTSCFVIRDPIGSSGSERRCLTCAGRSDSPIPSTSTTGKAEPGCPSCFPLSTAQCLAASGPWFCAVHRPNIRRLSKV